MAKKETEPKVILEREYVIPLRRKWMKVPEYKRANKAMKAVKEFLARHMKIYDRDLNKIKVDIELNNELRFRGMRKPSVKVKVKAKKFDDGIVKVELSEVPQVIKYKLEREKKAAEKAGKKAEEKKAETKKLEEKITEGDKAEKKETTEEEITEKEEKKDSVVEAGFKIAKDEHRKMKHEVAGPKIKTQPKRVALQK